MLSSSPVACALPAQDMERAKAFYKEKLELSPIKEVPGGLLYECGEGTRFFLFTSAGAPRGEFTQMGFTVADLRNEVAELKQHGLEFEHYDMPGLKTDDDGIATMDDGLLSAWFKDSEGNMIALTDMNL